MATMNRVRDWWEGISPREQRLVVGLGVTAVAVVLAYIGLQINDGLVTIAEKNDRTRFALNELYKYRLNKDELDSQPKVPIPGEPVKLETYLDEIAQEVGIKIPAYNKQSPETKGDFTVTSRQIELRDVSIYELKDFLQKVETKRPAVAVTEVQIRPKFKDKEKLNVPRLIVSTYSKTQTDSGDNKTK